MIKNWKLFLESKDPFEGDSFREEILNNVNDILSVLKDDGFEIKYSYGIDDVNVFPGTKPNNEFKFKVFSPHFVNPLQSEHYLDSGDFQSITHLHNYLVGEGFKPVSKNILGELDIKFHILKKILSYPISRFEYYLKEDNMKFDWIMFEYKLPFGKWKGNYTSIR